MPALNFQPRFAPLVESGQKRQTIRKHRKDGRDPKPGDRLYLYTGMRTDACRKLGEAACSSVREFEIEYLDGGVFWMIEDHYGDVDVMTSDDCDDLARRDGFASQFEMTQWFLDTHGLPFRGLLICWKEVAR